MNSISQSDMNNTVKKKLFGMFKARVANQEFWDYSQLSSLQVGPNKHISI